MPAETPIVMPAARGFCIAFALFWSLGPTGESKGQQLPLVIPFSIDGVLYDANIPTPESVLGHRIGDRHTRPHQIVEYFEAVAAASDRVSLTTYGYTYEGRPLIAAAVTNPSNQSRLETLRDANLRLSEDARAVSDEALEDMPVVAQFHYTVHGNEASGSEAAILLLYHLAAGDGAAVSAVLDNSIVVIDPCINPDGRDRFVDWVNGNRSRGGNPDPQDREHHEPWPGGRTNHYWFDLNRDWLPAQLVESQARLELFHSWRPHVLLDAHEMGSDQTFFFQPGVPERTNPNTPVPSQNLTDRLARYTARALDRIGSLYFTREQYDDFYYGKGSTYPDVNGAIGILFEQASSRALVRSTDDGDLSLAFGVRNQLAASLGLLDGAVGLRGELLANQRDFYRTASEESRAQPVRGWVFGSEEDRTRSDMLVQTLLRHRVEVYALARRTTVDGRQFASGASYVVPADQSQFRLAKTLFERVRSFEDSVFYDVSTWTLPLAFGVAHGEVTGEVNPLLGERLEDHVSSGGHLIGGKSDYGYLMSWDRYYAPRALYRFLAAGVPARVVLKPFELNVAGQRVRFDRGSIVLPVNDKTAGESLSSDAIHSHVMNAVLSDHVVIHSIGQSLTVSGPDFGGPSAVRLHLPKVAAIAGSKVSAYRLGELRHLLNERMEMPITLLDVDRLDEVSLDLYQTLVMVDGDYQKLSSDFVESVKSWANKGGRLVAIQRAAKWAAEQGLVKAEFTAFDEPDSTRWLRFEERDIVKQSAEVSGVILDMQLDASHPIAFGLEQRVASFKTTVDVLKPSVAPGTTVGVYTKDPVLSGYIPTGRRTAFSGTAAILSLPCGEGRVVLMEDSPTFRGFWYGTERLILNALLLAEAY